MPPISAVPLSTAYTGGIYCGCRPRACLNLTPIQKHKLPLTPNIPTAPVQSLARGGYQPYNPPHRQPHNPAAMRYNTGQGGGDEEGEEEEEEQDLYNRGYPSQYYPHQTSQLARGHHGYPPSHSEDVELRSPGVARRYPRDVMDEKEEGRLERKDRLTLSA